jgi:hypothetical protein
MSCNFHKILYPKDYLHCHPAHPITLHIVFPPALNIHCSHHEFTAYIKVIHTDTKSIPTKIFVMYRFKLLLEVPSYDFSCLTHHDNTANSTLMNILISVPIKCLTNITQHITLQNCIFWHISYLWCWYQKLCTYWKYRIKKPQNSSTLSFHHFLA